METDDAMAKAAEMLAARLGAGGAVDFRPMDKIKAGSMFVVRVGGPLLKNASSGDQIGKVEPGDRVTASGPPVNAGYYTRVPIRPKGAVDLSLLEPLDTKVKKPCAVGSWNGYEKTTMDWDESENCYQCSIQLGTAGHERFQIQLNGDWQMCLHPDVNDSCPHVPHKLCGPDNIGDGKDWVVGKHYADRGGEGVSYRIRLFVHRDGRAKLVDWVRTSSGEDSGPEDEGEEAAVPELEAGAPVMVTGLKGARGERINGTEGVCEAWDGAAGLWKVRLASGELQDLRRRYLKLCCEDVSGFWRDEKVGVSKIVQQGANVVVTSPFQPWSPASGSISGCVLTLSAPANVPCYAATVLNGDLKWVNDTVWRRATEEEYAIAVARENKQRMKALSASKGQQKGILLGGDGSDDDDDDLQEVSGPMALFLKASKRGATLRNVDERPVWRPRLGIDLKPSRPVRGLSPKFQWKSFQHRKDQQQQDDDEEEEEEDHGPRPDAGRRQPSPQPAPAAQRPPSLAGESPPTAVEGSRRPFAPAARAPAQAASSTAAAASTVKSTAPDLLPAEATEEAVPSIEEVLARLDREQDPQPPELAATEQPLASSPAATKESVPSTDEVPAKPDSQQDPQPPETAAPSCHGQHLASDISASREDVPCMEELLARIDHELGPEPPEAAGSTSREDLPVSDVSTREAVPSIEELLARLDHEQEASPGENAVEQPSVSTSSTAPTPPVAPAQIKEPSIAHARTGFGEVADVAVEPAPDLNELLARLDREEEERLAKEHWDKISDIQRRLRGCV